MARLSRIAYWTLGMGYRKPRSARPSNLAQLIFSWSDRLRPFHRSQTLCGLESLEPRRLLAFTTGPSLGGDQAAWVDFDKDGWVDVSVEGTLYHNDSGSFTSFTAGLGAGIWGDYDNDGYQDYFSYESSQLRRNDEGTGFSNTSSVLPNLPTPRAHQAASFGDFNGDGFLDLYVGNYEKFGVANYPDSLVLSNGGPSFSLAWVQPSPRPARGVTTADFDEDGDLDIYVSNYRLEPNHLWQNDGQGNMTDAAGARGVAGSGHTIGSAFGDFDNDGHLDLFEGNFSHPGNPSAKFLRNLGPDGGYHFRLMDELDGDDWQESYASPSLADYDNDGDIDLYFTTVYAGNHARLYRNDGNWNFTNVTGTEGLGGMPATYQAAWADYDNDGDLDLLTAGTLYVNDASQQTSNNWLKVQLIGDGNNVNTSAIGAIVRVQAEGNTLTRQVESATGARGNGNDHTLHFGLGNVSTPVSVEVTWPDGTVLTTQQIPNRLAMIPYRLTAFGESEIGEVGQITNLTHVEQTITLKREYDNPVVFAQSASNNGTDPVAVRVDNVQSNQFDIFLTEPANENGMHGMETVNYVVMEAGVHVRPDGTRIEVGTVPTARTVGNQVFNQWQPVDFDSPFAGIPIVLSQIQTVSDRAAGYLQTRYLYRTSSSVVLALEQEEAATTPHSAETVGYLAMDAGSGTWNSMTYEAGTAYAAVTSNLYDLTYTRSYDAVPRVLTSLASYLGNDNSHVRFTNASTTGVQIKVSEDTTLDAELDHYSAESVDYLVIEGDGMLTALEPQWAIGEVGTLNDLTHGTQTVRLERSYENPVVFAQSPSYNGTDPVAVRVDNVQSDQFDIYLAEPSDENGLHGGETVSYVVLEAGLHHLIDGTRLKVGTVDTSATVGKQVSNEWKSVRFDTTFEAVPEVFSQVQSATTGKDSYLHTRQKDRTTQGFDVALEQEESITSQYSVPETIGYLALDGGSGNWGGTMSFEAGATTASVTDAFYDLTFNTRFSAPPALLSSMASYFGSDNGLIRYETLTTSGVRVRVREDTTADTETSHAIGEIVSYLAIDGAGTLLASIPQWDIGEVGKITDLTEVPQTIMLRRQYANPVVFAQSASYNGYAPVAVRVSNVQSDQFDIYLQEPSNENNIHGLETVTYLVLEAGVHRLVSGKRVEVGTVATSATAGNRLLNEWETVDFDATFSKTPVVLSQIQTETTGGQRYLNVRYLSTSPSDVTLALEQEEAITAQHVVPETIGYLALDPGIGVWSGLVYEAEYTPTAVTHAFHELSYTQFYDGDPGLLTSLATYNGNDNAHVRTNGANERGVQVKIQEDTTFDEEIMHLSVESIAYLVINDVGLLTAQISEAPPKVTVVWRNGGADTYDTLTSLAFTFSEDVTVTSDALHLTNDSASGTVVNLAGAGFHYDVEMFTATWDLTNVAGITPAFYTATLDATKVSDSTTMNLDGDADGTAGDHYGHTFLVAMRGDVDLDDDVDLLDFNTLTKNYDPLGTSLGNDWEMANFDDDNDVDITDFKEILRNYSPLGHVTPAVRVASNVVPLWTALTDGQEIETRKPLVAPDSVVKIREDRVAMERTFADWADSSDEFTFFSITSARRRRAALTLG